MDRRWRRSERKRSVVPTAVPVRGGEGRANGMVGGAVRHRCGGAHGGHGGGCAVEA
jgi:hypothetical protein